MLLGKVRLPSLLAGILVDLGGLLLGAWLLACIADTSNIDYLHSVNVKANAISC